MIIIRNHTDLFLASGVDYIAHQVNCQGVMGAGLANTIRVVNPPVYQLYKQHCANYKPTELLGKAFICNNIISIFGQLNYGRDPNVVYTDYNALRQAFTSIHNRLPKNKVIAFPYNFGCGLAHGDWNTVLNLISECFQGRIIVICKRD